MLGPDDIADLEGEHGAACRYLRADVDTPIPELVELATGWPIAFDPTLDTEGRFDGRVTLRAGVPDARAKHNGGHELSHWWLDRIGYRGLDLEERCDALGAMFAAPRETFLRVIKVVDHAVYDLANTFGITQSVAMLRVGEVTGRPVLLLRWAGAIVRGYEFGWPSISTLVRLASEHRESVHPLKIRDEANRVGFMARREPWVARTA
jgi:hypothetical protein